MTDFFLVLWEAMGTDAGKTVGLVAFGIGVVIAFFVGLQKNAVEVRNLRSQIIANVAQFLASAQEARKRYSELAARCGRLATDLRNHLQGGAGLTEIDDARELFCGCLLHETIPAYLCDVEWQHLDRQNDGNPDELMTIVEDAAAELERFKSWLDVINHPNLLTHLQRNPAKIQHRTLRPFLRVVEKFPPTMRNDAMRRARQIVDALVA